MLGGGLRRLAQARLPLQQGVPLLLQGHGAADIADRDKLCPQAFPLDRLGCRLHKEDFAGLAPVANRGGLAVMALRCNIVRQTDICRVQRQEFFAAIAIGGYRRRVDIQKPPRFEILDPHRVRMVLIEYFAVLHHGARLLCPNDVGRIGDP